EPLTQRDMQEGEVPRATASDRVDDLAPLGGGVRLLPEGDERGGRGSVGEPDQGRRHAVERRARHQADGERGRHTEREGGGPPAALRTDPPARCRRARASSAPTPARTITTAIFTLPPAASMAARARGRSG